MVFVEQMGRWAPVCWVSLRLWHAVLVGILRCWASFSTAWVDQGGVVRLDHLYVVWHGDVWEIHRLALAERVGGMRVVEWQVSSHRLQSASRWLDAVIQVLY